jgi:hypothetical protein
MAREDCWEPAGSVNVFERTFGELLLRIVNEEDCCRWFVLLNGLENICLREGSSAPYAAYLKEDEAWDEACEAAYAAARRICSGATKELEEKFEHAKLSLPAEKRAAGRLAARDALGEYAKTLEDRAAAMRAEATVLEAVAKEMRKRAEERYRD